MKEWNLLSFDVYYDFVAQKWRILEIFHTQKKSILGKLLARYWDLKQWLKAKILKLWLQLPVATIKKSKLRAVAVSDGFWVAELRVRQVKIGHKSCFANDRVRLNDLLTQILIMSKKWKVPCTLNRFRGFYSVIRSSFFKTLSLLCIRTEMFFFFWHN